MKSRFAAAPSVYYCGGRGDFVVYRAVSAAVQAKNDVMCLFLSKEQKGGNVNDFCWYGCYQLNIEVKCA